MADIADKYEDNEEGTVEFEGKKYSFYVDRECIFCSVCSQEAPDNFKASEDGDHDHVYKQPENEIELEQCLCAIELCPVFAIGDNGYEE